MREVASRDEALRIAAERSDAENRAYYIWPVTRWVISTDIEAACEHEESEVVRVNGRLPHVTL